MISALLVAVFFASMFEVNAVCLRYIESSKESVAAIQGVQDRLETLRSLAYTDLTNVTALTTLLSTPSNVSDLATRVTETVTITPYDINSIPGGPTGTPLVINRPPGATAVPVVTGSASSIANASAVLVDVQYDWVATFGGRARTERTTSVISAGVKK